MNQSSCTYEPNATIHDSELCIFPQEIWFVDYLDCDGNCYLDSDDDGICNDGDTCWDQDGSAAAGQLRASTSRTGRLLCFVLAWAGTLRRVTSSRSRSAASLPSSPRRSSRTLSTLESPTSPPSAAPLERGADGRRVKPDTLRDDLEQTVHRDP